MLIKLSIFLRLGTICSHRTLNTNSKYVCSYSVDMTWRSINEYSFLCHFVNLPHSSEGTVDIMSLYALSMNWVRVTHRVFVGIVFATFLSTITAHFSFRGFGFSFEKFIIAHWNELAHSALSVAVHSSMAASENSDFEQSVLYLYIYVASFIEHEYTCIESVGWSSSSSSLGNRTTSSTM